MQEGEEAEEEEERVMVRGSGRSKDATLMCVEGADLHIMARSASFFATVVRAADVLVTYSWMPDQSAI